MSNYNPDRFGETIMLNLASQEQKAGLMQHFNAGDFDAMASAASSLLAIYPDDGELWHWYGVACLKTDITRNPGINQIADTALRRASELLPQDANVWDHRGLILCRLGRHQLAKSCFERSVALDPACAGTWSNAAKNANESGNFVEGARYAREGVARDPAHFPCHFNLGSALKGLGQASEASRSYRRALALDPDNFSACSSLLFSLSLDEALIPATVFAEHLALVARFEASRRQSARLHQNTRDPGRRLKLGFVSGDLCRHSVAFFVQPVWAALDPSQVELWVYATSATEDDVTRQLRGLVSVWCQVANLSEAALAEQIRADGIDVLFDLSGHTAHNRLLSFARKPAPVQVTWLGYPNTTGLKAMDYVLADCFNAPHGLYEHFYVEKFARLPSSGTFARTEGAPPVNVLPALGNSNVTFGSFNNISKLGEQVVAAWSRVLQAVPSSRLLVGNVSDPAPAQQLTERFGRNGISAERLIFKPNVPLHDYLALHHEVDIMLDTWPYTGGTTTNHALWMGVPVLTLQGPSRAHCQSAAILGRMGLQDWVAKDMEEFVGMAVQWANALPELARLRAGMRERWQTAPLRQPTTVARGLEQAVRVMWQRWCAGLPAEHFEIGPDAVFGPSGLN